MTECFSGNEGEMRPSKWFPWPNRPTVVMTGLYDARCSMQVQGVNDMHHAAVECLSRVTLVAEVNAGFHVSIIGSRLFPIYHCVPSCVIIISVITHRVSFSSLETYSGRPICTNCTVWG